MSDDKKVELINDSRLKGYTKRTRSGSTQIFYTGGDERDFERYRKEGGTGVNNGIVKMHDKPDTIRIEPPQKHYYSKLIDGEWWWVNGCSQCNGKARSWLTYVECDIHDVCRTCGGDGGSKTRYGGQNGWQCKKCYEYEKAQKKRDALLAMEDKEYDEWDYIQNDKVVCPHCDSSYDHDCEPPDGEEECDVCGGTYSVEPIYSVTFTTRCVGERLTSKDCD
jgi:hypothetical protein